jgi:phosphatidylserine/phosphatidylglycerophosphate/cardiolipin synthase-like enzyme
VKTCLKWGAEEQTLLNVINKSAAEVVAEGKTVRCNDVDFVMDDPSFAAYNMGLPLDSAMTRARLEKKHTTRELTELVRNTHSVLHLENWSYDPWDGLKNAIANLRENHVPVHVFTNRVTDIGGAMDFRNVVGVSRDNLGSQSIRTLSYKGSMNDRWEQSPKTAFWMIHSKVFVSDENTTAVASYNIDARSYHFNLESAVIARNCPAFAQEALAHISALNRNFEKDASCKECQHEPSFKFTDRLLAILGASYY